MAIPPVRYLVCEFNKVSGNLKGILARFQNRDYAEDFMYLHLKEYPIDNKPLLSIVDTQKDK